ncbi:MAG: hypothetical protein AB9888_03370 [Bacteroidales bacterium]
MRTKLTFLLSLICIIGAYAQPDPRIARTPKINYDWQPGFVSITEVTGAFGLGITDDDLSGHYYGLTTIAGYQFARNIKVGAGAGLHIHQDGTLLPLFLDIRYSFNSQEIVPYFAGDGGIMLDFNNLENTRIFINPSAGLKYLVANRTGISFSTGLMVSTGGPNARKSFINFKLGIEFKGKE